ncbi:MAG: hypothetical protein ACRBCI_11520 [Cellvibrionaceae bacterium]
MNDKSDGSSGPSIEERFFLKNAVNVFNRFDHSDKVMTFDDVYRYVVGRNENIDMEKLAENPILMGHYHYVLKTKGRFFSPKVVAAKTSGEKIERGGDGFSVKIIPSNSKEGLLYAIVELKDKSFEAKGKRIVLHVYKEVQSCCKIFPPFHDNKTHLLIESDDSFIALLSDDMSEISIVIE